MRARTPRTGIAAAALRFPSINTRGLMHLRKVAGHS